eukprot:84036-Rhodomonas_salina.1
MRDEVSVDEGGGRDRDAARQDPWAQVLVSEGEGEGRKGGGWTSERLEGGRAAEGKAREREGDR